MEIINLTRYYCPACGHDQLQKKGKTKDGRQRYKCQACSKRSTYGSLKKGERFFKPEKLLPILLKNQDELSLGELYSMGLLISDGCIDIKNRLTISLQYKDGYILEYVKSFLLIPNEVKVYETKKSETSSSWSVAGRKYKRLIWGYKFATPYWEKLGMLQNKTGNEIWLPYMNSWSFIRGFLDGDGCISNNKIIFTCANIDFLQNLQKFIGSYINNFGSLYKDHSAFDLSFTGKHALELGNYLYQDSEGLRLERKYNKYLEILNNGR